jgi:hypothetical protein
MSWKGLHILVETDRAHKIIDEEPRFIDSDISISEKDTQSSQGLRLALSTAMLREPAPTHRVLPAQASR